ncbi:MAG: hypothetical protein U9N52_10970 [Campylobacterota bacterium]|nr:hypothetical protein [Campylobacterota bacterium]
MDGGVYYLALFAFSLAAVLFLKNDRWMLAFVFVALAGWTYYSHETGVTFNDLKQDLNEAVDESAHDKYDKKIGNKNYEYDTNEVK